VVLFEMLAGQRVFEGETASDILAAVIKDEPDWSGLPSAVPPRATSVLRRCLAKDPRARLHDVADVRLLLEDAARDASTEATRPATGAASRRCERLAWATATLALTLAAGALLWRPGGPASDTALTRFTVTLPEDQPLAFADVPILTLSPDGRTLAFAAFNPESSQSMIHLRTLEQTAPWSVPGTEGGNSPFLSPDGRSIGFFADGRLKKVAIGGGPAFALADAPTQRGGTWGEDGFIYFSPEYTTGLWRVASTGGRPEPVVEPDADRGERTYRWPDALPGGEAVLFTIGALDSPNNFNDAQVAVVSLESGEVKVLLEGASMARFVPPDTLAYSRAGILYTVPFDPERLEIRGDPSPVLEGIGGDPSSGAGYFSVARNGTLVFVPGDVNQGRGFLTVSDRAGRRRPLPLDQRGLHHPRFSPEGERLAFVVGVGSSGAGGDVWVYSLATESMSRLTFGGQAAYPLWTPDGTHVVFNDSRASAIVKKAADGSGALERLTPSDPAPLLPGSWSPDGRTLAYTRLGPSNDVYLVETDEGGGEARLFETDAGGPVFSPDGRWIAYSQPGSGNASVFVRPVRGEGKWQVSPGVGSYPRWRADGREMYYMAIREPGRPVMAIEVQPGEGFRAGPARRLFGDLPTYRFLTSTAPFVNWDVSPSGDAFVFVELERDEADAARIEVAIGWAQHTGDGLPHVGETSRRE
jgi:serine/threonine-protein kinase